MDDQTTESLRRIAKRHGLIMRKLTMQDRYILIDPVLRTCVLGDRPEPFSATLRDIQQFLKTYKVGEAED